MQVFANGSYYFCMQISKTFAGKFEYQDEGYSLWNSDKSDFAILEMKIDKTHVHILVESEPKTSVLQIVRRLTQVSIVKIWEEAPN